MNSLRIAAVLFNSPRGETGANLERMERWAAAARREGAAIACFPELNITGYGVDAAMPAAAEPIPGRVTEALVASAQRHEMVILAGVAEKASDGRIFASHLTVTPEGVRGLYRKLHIAPPESKIFSAGDRIGLFEAAGVRFGLQLCYDAHFPELATRMALEGAEVIFMPHASPRGTPGEKLSSWMRHLPARAFDNGVFVVAWNQVGENGAGLAFPGAALAVGPDGRVLTRHTSTGEGMMIVELNGETLTAVRRHPMRYFLPHRRPDLSRLPTS